MAVEANGKTRNYRCEWEPDPEHITNLGYFRGSNYYAIAPQIPRIIQPHAQTEKMNIEV